MSAAAFGARRGSWAGVLVLIACAALWSLNGPLIKLLAREQVPGITIACYRSLIGGCAFLPFAWSRVGTFRNVPMVWPLVTMLTFTIMTASFVIANTLTEASNAIALQYTSPIWVFALSPLLLGERAGLREGLGLLVSMAGIGVIVLGDPGDWPGLLMALLSGWGYGTLTVLLRLLRPVSSTVVAAVNALGSGVLLLIPAGIWGTYLLSPYQTILIAILAVVQFTFPYFLFSWALQRVEAHRAALILLLEVVLNPIWTYFTVGEVPPPATRIGAPLILLGVAGWLLVSIRSQPQAAPAAAVPPP